MARIRSIKPDFWTDEKIVEFSHSARLLFIGLWNFADDEGRMEFSPRRLKMQIFPADTLDISELFGELRRERVVSVYVVDGKEYLQVVNFDKHQKVDKRTASKFPAPDGSPESPRIPPTEGNGREGKGKGKETKNAPDGAAFDELRKGYPKREGGQRWADAKRFYTARLKEGHTHADILAGVTRYAGYCKSKGIVGTSMVQQAATFVGTNKGFLETWAVAGADGPRAPKSDKQRADEKHAEDMTIACANVKRYRLRPQMQGEPDDSFLSRVSRETTEAMTRKQA